MGSSSLLAASMIALAGASSGAIAQSAGPTREIDRHAGIFFFCKPAAGQAWSQRACQEAGDRLATLAAEAKKPIVLLKIGDTRDKYPELARAVGFDSSDAVWFLLSIDPHVQLKGKWELAARADHRNKAPSAGAQPQVVTSSMRATVDASTEVAAKGKELLGTLMLTLTGPMRTQ